MGTFTCRQFILTSSVERRRGVYPGGERGCPADHQAIQVTRITPHNYTDDSSYPIERPAPYPGSSQIPLWDRLWWGRGAGKKPHLTRKSRGKDTSDPPSHLPRLSLPLATLSSHSCLMPFTSSALSHTPPRFIIQFRPQPFESFSLLSAASYLMSSSE